MEKRNGWWFLFVASLFLPACEKEEEAGVTPSTNEEEVLPTISIGDGSRTNAHRALNAASQLSVVSDAWLEFSGREGQTQKVRLISLDTQRRSPLFGKIDYVSVELFQDGILFNTGFLSDEELTARLRQFSDGARSAGSEPKIMILALDDLTSGTTLVEVLRRVVEADISRIVVPGAHEGPLTKEQVEDPDNAPLR